MPDLTKDERDRRSAYADDMPPSVLMTWLDEAHDRIDGLERELARMRLPPSERDAAACTCSYEESDEMTRHAPLCVLAGSW